MKIESELIDINTPPKDTFGYFGLVLKPVYMPLWLAKILRNHLEIREGWLNMPSAHSKPRENWDKRWWFDYSKGRENYKRCEPIYWCKIRTYYKVKLITNDGHPFTWKIEDPKGQYRISE
jgi:hypothetical protein